jgi:hypothetical protein
MTHWVGDPLPPSVAGSRYLDHEFVLPLEADGFQRRETAGMDSSNGSN